MSENKTLQRKSVPLVTISSVAVKPRLTKNSNFFLSLLFRTIFYEYPYIILQWIARANHVGAWFVCIKLARTSCEDIYSAIRRFVCSFVFRFFPRINSAWLQIRGPATAKGWFNMLPLKLDRTVVSYKVYTLLYTRSTVASQYLSQI